MQEQFKYFDIHGHLNFSAYDADRQDVVDRMKESQVGVINVGTQIDTSRLAVKLAEENDNMYACIGLHPIHTSASHHDTAELGEGEVSKGEEPDISEYLRLASHSKVVAIGECGLDYFRTEKDSEILQKKVFEAMIHLAKETGKPLMLHIRNGDGRSAYKDAYDILRNHDTVKGNLHFFAGSIDEAKPFLDLGYTFSFTGVITFARNYDEVIKYIPEDRIMSETDCPYVTPAPYRGKRNEPTYVIEVVKALSKIKNIEEKKMRTTLLGNVNRVFGISSRKI